MSIKPIIKKMPLDLIVVGAGPAGVSCAIQARRDGLDLLCISEQAPGGLLPAARKLDNLPAQASITGSELAKRLADQIESIGIDFRQDRVLSVFFDDRSLFSVKTRSGKNLRAKSICLATGTSPRPWSITIKGGVLHRDIRTLPADLSSKKVLVIGGGEAALDSALWACDAGAQVRLVARSTVHASPALLEESQKAGIQMDMDSKVTGAAYDGQLWIIDTSKGTMQAHELVVCIGREPRTQLLKNILAGKPNPSIVQHARPGLFLAGDIIRGLDRYTATAMGDGQRAAVLAGKYIKEVMGC